MNSNKFEAALVRFWGKPNRALHLALIADSIWRDKEEREAAAFLSDVALLQDKQQ